MRGTLAIQAKNTVMRELRIVLLSHNEGSVFST